MDTNTLPLTDPAVRLPTEGGRAIAFRVATEEDLPVLAGWAGLPTTHHLCVPGADASIRHLSPFAAATLLAVVGEDADQHIAGLAWLERRGQEDIHLGVAVHAGYQRTDLCLRLIQHVADWGRLLGVREVKTQIYRDVHDPLQHLRAAGMRINSSFTGGGVTDVDLTLE